MDSFVGEVRVFPFGFAPQGWLECDGRSLRIADHDALYHVIGTRFGGDATFFYLPEMRCHSAMGAGEGRNLSPRKVGDSVGHAKVTLEPAHLPTHTHQAHGRLSDHFSHLSQRPTPQSWISGIQVLGPTAVTGAVNSFVTKGSVPEAPDTTLAAGTLSNAGSSIPHENRQPYLAMGFYICEDGPFRLPDPV